MNNVKISSQLVKLYIPIENLEVENEIYIGDVIIHPSAHLQNVIETFNRVTYKTKNTDEQKKKFSEWYKSDLKQNFGNYAFAELERRSDKEDELIPKDVSPVYEKVKDALAVLYILQKQIAGRLSIEHQKFGLKSELYRSLNCIVALQGKNRSTYSLQKEGILGDWTFVNREINKLAVNPIYNYFNQLLKQLTK